MKTLLTALVATVGVATFAAPASAFDPSALSISEAKHAIKSTDQDTVARLDPGFLRNSVSGCYRVSRAAVNCHVADFFDDGAVCNKRITASVTKRLSIRFRYTAGPACS